MKCRHCFFQTSYIHVSCNLYIYHFNTVFFPKHLVILTKLVQSNGIAEVLEAPVGHHQEMDTLPSR